MIRRPPRSTRTDTLFPYTTLFRSNIRVIDLSKVLAGPLCGQFLGELGADVIKVEPIGNGDDTRSEEQTSELQSLMRISYAVFCLKKKKHKRYTKRTKTSYPMTDNKYERRSDNLKREKQGQTH